MSSFKKMIHHDPYHLNKFHKSFQPKKLKKLKVEPAKEKIFINKNDDQFKYLWYVYFKFINSFFFSVQSNFLLTPNISQHKLLTLSCKEYHT